MKAISFAELTKQVHVINDLILSDMVICGNEDSAGEAVSFRKHLLATKYWFARISGANKKRYMLALLEDVRSAWTLSLLLKSLWNCRPKDAVMSVCERHPWSSYDQVPMDHNRTALPLPTLAQVMRNDRVWFLTLEPESQAIVLSELLTIAGGPVMWAVLKRAQILYERYRNKQLQDLLECIVVNEPPSEKGPQGKKDQAQGRKGSGTPIPGASRPTATPGQAQKELEANLIAWNATIKSMKDSLKLEELEMTFTDGTKRKIWKVNRMKPEAIETVDFIQLLPSSLGKRILSYLPTSSLNDYARVNKYWAFLVDEYRAEINVRLKLDMEFEKLQEIMLRHDASMDILEIQTAQPSSQGMVSVTPSVKARVPLPSTKASEKSAGAYSMRYFLNEKLKQPAIIQQKPIRNMAELSERLERRGAADDMLWKWCENIIRYAKKTKNKNVNEDVIPTGNMHFPCPLMKMTLQVPLCLPLIKDPAIPIHIKPKRNISNATVMHIPKEAGVKRYSLWTRNLSSLYPVFKVPSHQSPI
ncbi:hypothetical protein K1T71_007364 [Dendrolimus kikuchii]|uniref:Uncharacterized protein n=1 Tax=Dendrolimus kikuchii TaxID=765133 RepID=A0ACC1D0K4_9NEOP|nr:hypothetical protein K1T71_007364 [Dendrolimus kikuchii]